MNVKKSISLKIIDDHISKFHQKFFKMITVTDWNSWKWQIRNRIQSLASLKKFFTLTAEEKAVLTLTSNNLPLAITPYYAALISNTIPITGIRKTVIPQNSELLISEGELIDPLNEDLQAPVKCIVHRYPDRVLFLATQNCAVYCRYCTRARIVGDVSQVFLRKDWLRGIEYIQSKPQIRDVLISGGDPLFLDDSLLEQLVREIRKIKHVEVIRFGTKIPMVLPYRITEQLTKILKKYHPIFFSIHVTHPDELTTQALHACELLANSGIPMGSQTVLLKGVNDSVDVLKKLMLTLLTFRIRPYALYQCDPIFGSAHFRVPIQKGLDIIQNLRGQVSGYAIPHYIVDPPGGEGKISLHPDNIIERTEKGYWLKNWKNHKVFYHDPL